MHEIPPEPIVIVVAQRADSLSLFSKINVKKSPNSVERKKHRNVQHYNLCFLEGSRIQQQENSVSNGPECTTGYDDLQNHQRQTE
jgi:hypothetical protein